MDLNNFFLLFFLVVFGLIFNKYFLLIIKKYNLNILVDNEFKKPQAFHENPVSIAGGVCIFFSLLIVYFNFLLFRTIN